MLKSGSGPEESQEQNLQNEREKTLRQWEEGWNYYHADKPIAVRPNGVIGGREHVAIFLKKSDDPVSSDPLYRRYMISLGGFFSGGKQFTREEFFTKVRAALQSLSFAQSPKKKPISRQLMFHDLPLDA